MTILSLWKSSPQLLTDKSVRQIIGIAGGGKLLDGNDASTEFRSLIAEIPSFLLTRYTNDCIQEAFPDSGLALQDLINEVGRRLGFAVTNGRYRGRRGANGNDGLWALPNAHKLIVEVKTTDAYRIDLNTIADYRRQMVREGDIAEEDSSILIVVGRTDTGDLEAQIRGSKSAWDMRLISIDALLRLMELKVSIEDPDALRRVYEILIPREFTKLDEIVDLVFSTAEDAKKVDDLPTEEEAIDPVEIVVPRSGPKFTPVSFNELVAKQVSDHFAVPLLKRTRGLFSSPDNEIRAVCVASREHKESTYSTYWFAFHPHQKVALEQAKSGYVAFGCGTASLVVLVPMNEFSTWLDGMNRTVTADRSYWHVHISGVEGQLALVRKKGQSKIDLQRYTLRRL